MIGWFLVSSSSAQRLASFPHILYDKSTSTYHRSSCCLASASRISRNFNSSYIVKKRLYVVDSSFLVSDRDASAFHISFISDRFSPGRTSLSGRLRFSKSEVT